MSFKTIITCDNVQCIEETQVPKPGLLPPMWILLKFFDRNRDAEGIVPITKSFHSMSCLVEFVKSLGASGYAQLEAEYVPNAAELEFSSYNIPDVEPDIPGPVRQRNSPEYDQERRKLLSRHRV